MSSTDRQTPDEVWRWVAGFEGLYMVSNQGRIMAVPKRTHRDGFVMSQPTGRNGYKTVHLRNGKTEKRPSVHRVVATAFIPNPDNLPEVNHIDGNKSNNRVENLEWCTRSENLIHAIRVLGRPKPPRQDVSPNRHLTFEQAQAIRADNRTQRVIAEEYGITQASVSLIKRGITYLK